MTNTVNWYITPFSPSQRQMGNKSSAIKVFTYFAVVDDTGEGHPVNINVQIQEGNNRGVLKFSF